MLKLVAGKESAPAPVGTFFLQVDRTGKGAFDQLGAKAPVHPLDVLVTNKQTIAQIELNDGTRFVLGHNSRVTITRRQEVGQDVMTVFSLDYGLFRVKSREGAPAGNIVVETPAVQIKDIGTIFITRHRLPKPGGKVGVTWVTLLGGQVIGHGKAQKRTVKLVTVGQVARFGDPDGGDKGADNQTHEGEMDETETTDQNDKSGEDTSSKSGEDTSSKSGEDTTSGKSGEGTSGKSGEDTSSGKSGEGTQNGNGDATGNGNGNGNGDSTGNGNGNGDASGNGNGNGDGSGNGTGSGSDSYPENTGDPLSILDPTTVRKVMEEVPYIIDGNFRPGDDDGGGEALPPRAIPNNGPTTTGNPVPSLGFNFEEPLVSP